ncbi:MAG: hypothetical protein V4722_18435 [Bacteroidota bacterium]
MVEKYKGKYRISSARLANWDYTSNGSYFITICTKDRIHFFGEISNDEMHLTEIGILAEKFWFEIPEHFPFVELGNFVVMPNHIHGIIIIDKNSKNYLGPVETLHCNVSLLTDKGIEDYPTGKNLKNRPPDNVSLLTDKGIEDYPTDKMKGDNSKNDPKKENADESITRPKFRDVAVQRLYGEKRTNGEHIAEGRVGFYYHTILQIGCF